MNTNVFKVSTTEKYLEITEKRNKEILIGSFPEYRRPIGISKMVVENCTMLLFLQF